jgi:hypothetical protein
VGNIGGPGSLLLEKGASIILDGAVSIARIAFDAAGPAHVTLDLPTQLGSVFSGFGMGDTIDLQGVAATSLSYADGTLSLLNAAQIVVDTVTFAGHYVQSDFALQADGMSTKVIYAGAADWFQSLPARWGF